MELVNKSKELKRKEIANKFYGKYNEINVDSRDSVFDYLNELYNYLNNYEYESNSDFIFCGRKRFIYDEIIEIMNGTKSVDNPLYFILLLLEEFLSNNNDVHISDSYALGISWNDLRDANDRYISTGTICLEEVEIIREIVEKSINLLGGPSLDKEITSSMPELLKDYTNVYNGEAHAKQKLPKESKENIESYNKDLDLVENNCSFYKKNENDSIWWVENIDTIGEYLFSFDKEKIYNLFRDYPFELSKEEKEIFDKENPYWADFFKDRKR